MPPKKNPGKGKGKGNQFGEWTKAAKTSYKFGPTPSQGNSKNKKKK